MRDVALWLTCGKTKKRGDNIPNDKIPELYATERIPIERKIIHQRYQIKEIGYYWLIAELDRKENLAFGYANLNNDDFAEWGYISIDELLDNGAELDEAWKPCTYREAINIISKEREERRLRLKFIQKTEDRENCQK